MSFEFEPLIDFVDTEFRSRFRNVIDQITLPIPRRVDQYTCWPGLRVLRSSPDTGRLELAFKRNPSKIRIGEHVYVNTMTVAPKDVISGPEGIIESIDEATGRMIIRPGFQQGSRFGQRFRIDDLLVLDQTLPAARMSREMPTLAIRLVGGRLGDHPRLERIRALLAGKATGRPIAGRSFDRDDDEFPAPLTPAQREALRRGVEEDFALVQGPPGTGKTWLLGLLIRELVRRGDRVAVCAFTHQAINNVLRECLKYPDVPDLVKIGKTSAWHGPADDPRLRLIESPGSFFRGKSTPAVTGLTQYSAFQPLARALDGDDGLQLPERFDVIIFDEAGQLTLPAALMAMVQADRFVFAGDHRQLPPVVATVRPGEGEGISVFQHLVERAGHEAVLLDRSFRLNDELVDFPSREFYDARLQSAPEAAGRRLDLAPGRRHPEILAADPAVQLVLIRHEGRGQEAPEEAALAASLVADAIAGGLDPAEIAVIAPHRRQNVRIREMLARILPRAVDLPLVDTVERIQGQERDLIILSMSISDPDILAAEADFLFLPNRFNVAATRARRKLVVLASPLFFRVLPRPEALDCLGRDPLGDLNVLKRWYFRQRSTAVDATEAAARALEEIESSDAPQSAPPS
ncbi:MAG: AAA family ATPase [Planctomycetes bacterium]|nr:AAA family ATPase [Planctomycetota bacterium]